MKISDKINNLLDEIDFHIVLGEDDQALRKLIELVRDMNKHPESSKIEQHKE